MISKNQKFLRGRILIVDDDRLFNDSLKEIMIRQNFLPSSAFSVGEVRKLCAREVFDIVLLDNQLPDGSGVALIPDILSRNDRTKIILITAFPSFSNAVEAIKQRAYDYISKPIDLDELHLTIERALHASSLETVEEAARYQTEQARKDHLLLGSGKNFAEILRLIKTSAESEVSVLITGETGTGKNLVAKAIHHASRRRDRPLISINCAAIPETLIEAELFGVEKGAFTGATQSRKGVFELAEGGTLFLDEIGEMPLILQSKLLNVIEDRQVKRVGAENKRFVDVRIIAATNADPAQAIREKRFRSDLFYRLSVMSINLPPLRERIEDIPELACYFSKRFAPNRTIELPTAEIEFLQNYAFPGNVRELKNIIERSLLLQEGEIIRPSMIISPSETHSPAISEENQENLSAANERQFDLSLAEAERRHILLVFERHKNNLTRTAAALQISLSTLKRKLREFGIR